MTVKIKHNIKSNASYGQIKNFDGLEKPIKEFMRITKNDAYWIIYNQNEVLLGKGTKEILTSSISLENLKEMRAFSPKGELHVWKYGNEFKYRLREDYKGNPCNIYIAKYFRLDTDKETKDKKNKDLKNHGIKLSGKLIDTTVPKKFRVYNYFEYDKNGCIKFIDARLVDFVEEDKNGKKI